MKRNHCSLIDNLAFADLSFGENLISRLFLIDIIDLVIASSMKDIKINQKYMPRFLLDSCG